MTIQEAHFGSEQLAVERDKNFTLVLIHYALSLPGCSDLTDKSIDLIDKKVQ